MLSTEHRRSQEFVLGGPENRGAKGAEIETPKASRGEGYGEGVSPLPSRLGGLGERRELPQRGPGRSPGRQRILGIFQGHRSLLVEKKQLHCTESTVYIVQCKKLLAVHGANYTGQGWKMAPKKT